MVLYVSIDKTILIIMIMKFRNFENKKTKFTNNILMANIAFFVLKIFE
ncbi:Uncharacterised protein [Chlamydia trachomatis]|nr:Uncharacterised protein [Chlamydia trachomatis]